jgi:hypothetical protein
VKKTTPSRGSKEDEFCYGAGKRVDTFLVPSQITSYFGFSRYINM